MAKVVNYRTIKIKVSPGAKAVISDTADALDMKEQGVASRIYEWFGRQSEDIQRTVLGLYGLRAKEVIRGILQEIEARESAEADEWAQNVDQDSQAAPDAPEQESEKSGHTRKRKRA